MTYVLLAGGLLMVSVILAAVVARAAGRGTVRWGAVAAAAGVLVGLTVVFDNLMIRLDLFTYAPHLISGLRVGAAPVEDLAYPLALVVVLPPLWALLTRSGGVPVGDLLRHAFLVSRPVSWINTAFPFASAVVLTTHEVDWLLVVGTFYYLVPYNLAMYGINDVFDHASDVKNPRKGGVEGALLPPRFHRPLLWLVVASNVPFLLVLLVAGSPAARAAVVVSSAAVVAYSIPGLRFKERPVIDSMTSSTHFVSPAVVGLALAGARFDGGVLVILTSFFLWGMAAHAFGAVQDILPDREAGIASIATVLGARRTVRTALGLWTAAGVLVLAAPWPAPLAALVAVPYLANCAPWYGVSDRTAAGTNRAWRRFIWLNYGCGFLVTLLMIAAW